jgi:hypothetical protein
VLPTRNSEDRAQRGCIQPLDLRGFDFKRSSGYARFTQDNAIWLWVALPDGTRALGDAGMNDEKASVQQQGDEGATLW